MLVEFECTEQDALFYAAVCEKAAIGCGYEHPTAAQIDQALDEIKASIEHGVNDAVIVYGAKAMLSTESNKE